MTEKKSKKIRDNNNSKPEKVYCDACKEEINGHVYPCDGYNFCEKHFSDATLIISALNWKKDNLEYPHIDNDASFSSLWKRYKNGERIDFLPSTKEDD